MFEWDEVKRQANLVKHGIDFAAVAGVFTDPARVEMVDLRRDHGEPRHVTMAPVRGRLLHVTWTWRGGKRRLISARKANAREQRRYERIRHEA